MSGYDKNNISLCYLWRLMSPLTDKLEPTQSDSVKWRESQAMIFAVTPQGTGGHHISV